MGRGGVGGACHSELVEERQRELAVGSCELAKKEKGKNNIRAISRVHGII
jgi:hypothetical protein